MADQHEARFRDPLGVIGHPATLRGYRVGAVPAGSRLTITTIAADPRAAAIAAAAAAIHLRLPGPVGVSDIVFVEGDLDDEQRRRLGRLSRRPARCRRRRGTTRPRPNSPSRSRSTRASPTPPPAPSSTPPPSSRCRLRRRRPAGASSSAGCDAVTIDALLRRVIANPVIERWAAACIDAVFHPGSDDVAGAESIAIRTLDDDGLARAQRRTRRWPSTSPSCGPSATTSPARAATRPTSSWRRSPRRGASTAPTRRSGAAITVDGATDHTAAAPAARRHRAHRAPRSCARRSSATPASSRSLAARRSR